MKMKKFIVVLLLTLILAQSTVMAATPPAPTKVVDGGFISASFDGGSIYGKVIRDTYYFNVDDAITFSKKISVSSAEALGWLATGFIPHAGPAFAVYGTVSSIHRSETAALIRKYTDQKKKVRVSLTSSNGVKTYSVSEWDGTYGKIKSGLEWASYLGVRTSYTYWKIGSQTYYTGSGGGGGGGGGAFNINPPVIEK